MKNPPAIPKYLTIPEWCCLVIAVLGISGGLTYWFAYPSVYKWVQNTVASDLIQELETVKGQLGDTQENLSQTETELAATATSKKDTEDTLQAEQTAHEGTKKLLKTETSAHASTQENLKLEETAHSETEKRLNAEQAAHGATKVNLGEANEKYDKLDKDYTTQVSKLYNANVALQAEVNRLKELYEKE